MYIILPVVIFACLTFNSYKPENGYSKAPNCGIAGLNAGIVYFSNNNGATWENRSNGLPYGIDLTDMAILDESILVATKQHGIFAYDFQNRIWKNLLNKPATDKNIDALNVYKDKIIVGTQGDGIFISADKGKSWIKNNNGLGNLTIRRIVILDGKVIIGTNGGLFTLDEQGNSWNFLFGYSDLQVNGITKFLGEIYIGSNLGIFKSDQENRNWKHVMKNIALHNISADDQYVYALAYNEMFASNDKGSTWLSLQAGLPKGWYTFQVKHKGNAVFAGQWDGVYKKTTSDNWISVSKGMPGKFAVTELIVFKDILVAASSGWIGKR